MRFTLSAIALLALLGPGCATAQTVLPELRIEPHQFTSRDARTVDAEIGRFLVPENRADPSSRTIELAFVRFPSTSSTPGNPIVYLAGGPGGSGSGTAAGPRFDIFMALREQADVIAFDQRGTGHSQALPDCVDDDPPDLDTPLTRERFIAYYREETRRCFDWWRQQGIDIAAWNTAESAADIEDLRRAIGAERIDLWAISYGTHLGAAYLRNHSNRVGRAVFAGYEGPDDTVKLPSSTDAFLQRVAEVVTADPAASAAYPNLLAMMRRVHERLETEPAEVTFVPQGATDPVTLRFGAFPIQVLTSFSISDPGPISRVPAFYLAMDNGDYGRAAAALFQILYADTAKMGAMPTAMDYASGITSARLARVEREAQTAVLGDALNFPMPHIWGIAPELDLGDAFRVPLAVDTPILFISGTLDGRTSPDAARDAMATLRNSRQLIVENGGHNIYEADPRMSDIVLDWLREGTAPERIHFDPPQFLVPR